MVIGSNERLIVKMDLKRPTSENEIQAILRMAYGLACKSQYNEALKICNWLIEDKASEVAGYRERASVKEHMNDIQGAISDLQAVVSLFAKEPGDFHSLGLLLLKSGSTVDAIKAFGKAISLCETSGNHYYLNSSLLFRAEAHMKRAEYADALTDATPLPSGYQTYISGSGVRSKEKIISEAEAALKRK